MRGARKDLRSGTDGQRCGCTWHTRGSAAADSVEARVRSLHVGKTRRLRRLNKNYNQATTVPGDSHDV